MALAISVRPEPANLVNWAGLGWTSYHLFQLLSFIWAIQSLNHKHDSSGPDRTGPGFRRTSQLKPNLNINGPKFEMKAWPKALEPDSCMGIKVDR